jgi:biopolymer transport protein ExbD
MASHLKDAQEEAKADMTPMIDCVFLLIIFFLCIDFKTLEAKLSAYLPKDKGSQTDETDPVEQLSLRIEMEEWGTEVLRRPRSKSTAYQLQGHRVRYMLGPSRYTEIAKLLEALEKIVADPGQRVPDKDKPGSMKIKPIVIEPQPGTTYGDVAQVVDAVTQAGFGEINFGGGRGSRKKN